MTCPTKRKCQRHLANTLKELSHRLVTFETFDQTDDKTWHFQNRQWQWQLQLENTLKDQYERLVTFETLITFLTIENNNLNIHSYPWIKSDRDGIRNSCDVFSICSHDKLADWLQLKYITAIGAEVFFQFCTNQKKSKFCTNRKKVMDRPRVLSVLTDR